MSDLFYKTIRRAYTLGKAAKGAIGLENLPENGPAVIVANHLQSQGPIAMICSIPRRLYPWVVWQDLSIKAAPAYIREDYLLNELHLPRQAAVPISYALGAITVGLMNGIDAIPVYPGPKLRSTYRRSLSLLEKGNFVLVFPEDAAKEPVDLQSGMKPFQDGIGLLAELYWKRVHEPLLFIPAAVHKNGGVNVGKPVSYNPGAGRHSLSKELEEKVIGLYREMSL